MLHKTRGIVLNYIKYSETSIITKIYTEELGLQTYIVNGVRSKNSKNKIALFQPLTLLDMVVYYKENASMNRISELRSNYPFKSIHVENKKSAIGFFIIEVLCKSINEDAPNKELFDFIDQSIKILDSLETDYENFHLQFLFKLAGFLGFGPSSPGDLMGTNINSFNQDELIFCESLLNSSYYDKVKASNVSRRKLLDNIKVFYALHIPNFTSMNSIKVLNELLRDR